MQYAEQDEETACHKCGDGQSLHTVLLDNSVDNDDKGSRGASNLYL